MKLIFELVAQDVNVAVELAKQRDALKEINKQLKGLDAGTDEYRRLNKEATALRLSIDDTVDAQKRLNNEIKAAKVPADSLAGLRLQYSRLAGELAKLSAAERNSDFGQKIIKDAARVKKEIDGIEQSVGRFTGNVGNYKSALDGLLNVVGFAGAVGVATGAISKFRDVNAELSDKIADVAKAADATQAEISGLAQSLSLRDTRTSLVDQLGIAEIGGKLGVAKQELFAFTQSVDTLNVALGDQFGGSAEETTEVVGKLRNVLTDLKSDKISEDILRIGNALNFLEAQGAASASTTADFAGRISGAARPLGVTSDKIIGLSATLDELGINAERGATASVRLLQRMATAPEAFAAAIDVPAKEFKDLVDKDIFGALQLFINKLNDKNLSNSALSTTLKTIDVDGAGVSEVIGKLGGNMELLSKRVNQAGTALGNTNSITAEFEKKNATFGASLDKLSNSFNALFTNSRVSNALAAVIDSLTGFIQDVATASDKVFNLSGRTTGLSAANDILANSLQKATAEIAKESVNTEKNFNILRNDKATRDQRNQAISDLLKLYPDILSKQQLEKASIKELEGIQKSLTNTLREQVTERAKIQAKAAIEQEILNRRIRQVELESLPDRAFADALTFGESARVFKDVGILEVNEISQARQSLKVQTENDIAALENKLTQVDARFNTLLNNRENNLSDAEQDELDRRRQFADRNKDIAKTAKEATESTDELTKSEIKANKERALTAGSLEFLQDRVRKLQEQLERAKPNQIPAILGDLVKAEQELKALQDSVEALRNPDTEQKQLERGQKQAAIELGTPDEAQIKELTDAQREAAVEFAAFDVEVTQDSEAMKLSIIKAFSEKKIDLTKEELEEQLKLEQAAERRKQEIREAARQALFDSAIALTQSIADNQTQQIEDEKDEKISALDEEYEAKREAAQGNAVALAQIDEEYNAKKEVIEKEAARERKRIAVIESIVAGALAVIKSLPNIPLAIATGIAAATQTAIIARQKFAVGGFTGKGGATDSTGERVVNAQLHEGEYVAPRAQVEQFPQLFAQLNRMRPKRGASTGVGYAVGGLVNFSTAPAIPLTQQQQQQTALNIQAQAVITEDLAKLIAKYVADSSYTAISTGLNDSNRNTERQQRLTELTNV